MKTIKVVVIPGHILCCINSTNCYTGVEECERTHR